jgi:hypothetical protein
MGRHPTLQWLDSDFEGFDFDVGIIWTWKWKWSWVWQWWWGFEWGLSYVALKEGLFANTDAFLTSSWGGIRRG